ncbi:hypothetical protein XELAEV_18011024mg [Xenopus laevis]|uniref:Helix-turn-helix domain-containing protein n=1 Tax=Xenopus laevis TaxID=8355 RepID=A0A974DWH4_XENLA|nr:hypothetical protein XELAEV_18011024mg [Xenopus laevis]
MKLELNYSKTEINFQDTTIHIRSNTLVTSIYRQPTERRTFLRNDSSHPKHIRKSIIYSQAIRYNCICSDPTDWDTWLQIKRAVSIPRENNNNRVPLVVTYNPHLESLCKAIMELQPILLNDKRLHNIFPEPPLLAYRHPPNLKGIIVRSSLQGPAENGTSPCLQKRCETCAHIYEVDRVPIPHHPQKHQIKELYVGETGQTLRQWMNSYRFKIKHGNTDVPVAAHFCSNTPSIKDLPVTILKGNFKTQQEWKEWE